MRPKFLDQPYSHTRSQRTAQSRVDYSCAIERPAEPKRDWVGTVMLLAVFAFLGVVLGWRM